MEIFSHIISLEQIGYFNAALRKLPITPYRIPEGVELVEIVTGGEVFFEHDNVVRSFGRGTVFRHIAGEYTIFDTPADAPYQCAVYRFRTSSPVRHVPRISFWQGSGEGLDDFFSMSRNWFSKAPDDKLLLQWCLTELAARTMMPGEKYGKSPLCPPGNDTLEKVLDYAEKHPEAPLDIGTLCRISGLCRNRLFLEFRKRFGTTPHNWTANKKTGHAKHLLESSAMPIKEIAGSCGFENIEVFYRIFKKYTGTTPGGYRKRYSTYHLPESSD